MLSSVLFSILCFFITYFILWKRRRLYYASYKLKGPFALPLIGNLLNLVIYSEDIIEKFLLNRATYGSPFRLWFGTKLFVYTSNPEDFEILFNSPHALNKKEIYEHYKPLAGDGLFTCSDVCRWRQKRRIIAKTFNHGILNTFIPTFQKHSLILCEKLEKMFGKGSFNVHSWLARCHVDIICETATGIEVKVQQGESEYVDCFERLCDIIYSRVYNILLHPDFIFKRTTLGKEQEKLINYIRDFNNNVVHSKRTQNEQLSQTEYSEKGKIFLDYLMETAQFTDNELNEELITFTLAGSHTTATTESFTLMLLGMHQKVQDRVFEEQQEIFGDNQRAITHTDLSEMKYLERVIKESMRVLPLGGVIFRTITRDIQLSTYMLPKDATVIFGMLDVHRNPSFWEDPLRFDPDRFLPENIAKQHPYSYIPFISGPRDCIGQKYAMMVMKVLLSTVVRKYRIFCEYKEIKDIKLIQNLTFTVKGGFRISLELRN